MAILVSPTAPVNKDVRKRQPTGKPRARSVLFQETLDSFMERAASTEKTANIPAPKTAGSQLVYPLVYPRTTMANIVNREDLTNEPSRLFWPA